MIIRYQYFFSELEENLQNVGILLGGLSDCEKLVGPSEEASI